MIRAFIGLGSNLDDPAGQLRRAFETLRHIPGVETAILSPLYASAAIGPGTQPDYVNAAALLSTTLDAHILLDALQRIEQEQGRIRGEIRWTARTLDLDLLFYGDQTIDTPRLQVPHPRIAERNFVLQPVLDLDPGLCFPDGRTCADLLAGCPDNRLHRLAPSY